MMNFTIKPLNYELSALEPAMSEKTLMFHHGKHLQAYVNNLNNLIPNSNFEYANLKTIITEAPEGAILNNAAQIWNHDFFFEQFSTQNHLPTKKIESIINSNFGSFDAMKEKMIEAGASLFGSGWVWLVKKGNNKLEIIKENNAGNPLRKDLHPILTIDVWEHAYYIDYQNRRIDYLRSIWDIIDWEIISNRL